MNSKAHKRAVSAAKSHGLNAAALYALGLLTMTQRDLDGSLLINGWHGLGAVCFALFALAFFHAISAIRAL